MTLVLVHGVPETAAVWDPLVNELGKLGHGDIVRFSPPGFGAPIPEGFETTVTGYRQWLVGELEQLEGDINLIGHDFGGAHVMGVAMTRPDLIRSWATDVIGVLEPDYVWHDAAQVWQRPNDGEAMLGEMFSGDVHDRVARLNGIGMAGAAVEEIAAAQGPEMARAILALYRSAAQPTMADLGRDLPKAASRPGLAIIATEDHAVGDIEMRQRGARRANAQVEHLVGLGHWWMLANPARAAQAISSFLNGVARR